MTSEHEQINELVKEEAMKRWLESDRLEVDLINRITKERDDARYDLRALRINYQTLVNTAMDTLKENSGLRAEIAFLNSKIQRMRDSVSTGQSHGEAEGPGSRRPIDAPSITTHFGESEVT